jgi:hypothetical protein
VPLPTRYACAFILSLNRSAGCWQGGGMVIKTEVCSFSEYKVYPGHGCRFVRRDGTVLNLSTSKTRVSG